MKSQLPINVVQYWPKRTQWILFAIVLVICTITSLFSESARELLRYESGLVSQHEYWRLITAHFVHLGWSHYLLNMAGFFALWVIYADVFSINYWLFILILGALGISVCFLNFDQSLIWYVGLSGVLHTIIAAVLMNLLLQLIFLKKDCFHWEDGILLIFLILKLSYEQFIGAVPFTEAGSGGPVIVNAHFYGAFIGCICAFFLFKFTNSDAMK